MRDIAELWRAGTSFELEFSDLKSQFDVFRAVKRVTADFGWRTFMIMRMPRDLEDATLSGLSIICNWPAELLNRYDQIGIFKDSPIVTRLKNSVIPFRFDLSNVPPGDRVGPLGEVVELLYHHNMPRGIYFPVHDAFGNRAAIVYSGDRPAAGIDEMLQLSMISALLYERISQLKYADEKPAEELSDRESPKRSMSPSIRSIIISTAPPRSSARRTGPRRLRRRCGSASFAENFAPLTP
jgi:LuxR family transcriptional regulator, quorum-sensing system regulator BjaR1